MQANGRLLNARSNKIAAIRRLQEIRDGQGGEELDTPQRVQGTGGPTTIRRSKSPTRRRLSLRVPRSLTTRYPRTIQTRRSTPRRRTNNIRTSSEPTNHGKRPLLAPRSITTVKSPTNRARGSGLRGTRTGETSTTPTRGCHQRKRRSSARARSGPTTPRTTTPRSRRKKRNETQDSAIGLSGGNETRAADEACDD